MVGTYSIFLVIESMRRYNGNLPLGSLTYSFQRMARDFYVQCPIDRAPHTMAFGNPVMEGNVQ